MTFYVKKSPKNFQVTTESNDETEGDLSPMKKINMNLGDKEIGNIEEEEEGKQEEMTNED